MRGTTTLRQTCRRGCFGAICVQRFDDSRNSAIHTTYRSSLRSSSLREPRYPLLRVVFGCAGGAAFLNERARPAPRKTSDCLVWMCVVCAPAAFATDAQTRVHKRWIRCLVLILPQVHLRKPCYDFSFL